MKIIARVAFALLLTLPIYIGVSANPWLSHWFNDGNGWDVASPIFHVLGSDGGEEDEDYLCGTLLLVSFALALLPSHLTLEWVDRNLRRAGVRGR
ncbi:MULTISPECIES: hypothetical protein [Burkholderia]|uniref:hypothetical protein n=1 Tax=Burkholderia TaxID=32008 RepID=UPI00050F97C1|nr:MULTISPECIES: hypothetical protein [Burkholderia]AYQ86915.1 hypothetical protein EDD84_05615 [Burkholderia gladioli]KGE10554.1 hypothetical protein LA03_09430 [Burkholderia gladioli]KVM64305.1 hypothetical protein WJ59_21415 [Burkholderia gladioli]NBI48142.1 hypothetical protein [Burkholderia sp. ISTR5]